MQKTDEILGVHVIDAHASELIAEAVVAMEFRASSEDIARIVPRAPVAVGGDARGGARGGQAGAAHVRDSLYPDDESYHPPAERIGGGSVFDSAEYTQPAARLPLTVLEYYQQTLAKRGFVRDEAAVRARCMRLQRLYEEWAAYKERRSTALRRLVVRRRCRAACTCGAAWAAARAS